MNSIAGKNKRRQLAAYDSVHGLSMAVDSQEEIDALNFCCEAASLSVIDDFAYQPCSFSLAPAVDYVDVNGRSRCMFRDHVYSPDFCIMLDPKRVPELSREFKVQQKDLSSAQVSVYVDVKGTFAGHDGGRAFSLNQKWTWQKFGIYVYKLVPKMFFRKAGCPKASFYSKKTKKARKMFAGMRTISETLGLNG